jgi:hypothetical protein
VAQRWKERDKMTVVPRTGKQMNGTTRNGRPEDCWYQEREAGSTFSQKISRLLDCCAMVQEDYISVLRTEKYYLNGLKIIIHMTEFYIGHL